MSKPGKQGVSTSSNRFTALISITNNNEKIFIVKLQRLLSCYALLTLIAVIGFLIIRSTWIASFWLFLIGFGASGLYPIAKAEAYTRQPGHSGTVRAIINIGAPFEVALPGIAGRSGILASLAFLGLAPLLILILIPRRISNLSHLTA